MSRGLRAMTIVTVLALALTAVTYLVFKPRGGMRVTAYFSSAVGLYEGSTVRVLGVPVGTVVEVTPAGRQVRAELSIDSDRWIPASASAVVVAPSLVSDRFVQLTPAYAGGARMESGATIPVERTVTPVELDDLYKSLSKLSTALGPDGANSKGEFSRLLDVMAANTKGNGALIGETIKQFADASKTLAGAKDQLFGTVDGLQQFTTMLARNDKTVVQFTKQLREVSASLAAERADLGGALAELAVALEQVRGFIKDNRNALKSNVDKLTGITKVLVDQRASLAEALDVAPNAVENLNNAINPKTGALEGRVNLPEFYDPGSMVACNVTPPTGPVTSLSPDCKELKPGTGGPPLLFQPMGEQYTSEGGG
ncbi:virulence factor Mce-like protein [Kibdelosporangium banguiense]|uniref:Virulence factor Mce-like protein n=1 Tax=Kibdelosporangium banguiense TaxID=1365924 RepID=A0ABS4TM58_9PSEU|nr:MCE family protein [Kibdelosporangium banguiense]MBP2325498.1 virulence factor Mce-like protein [Kibdelosporangium banguiense]